MKRRTVLLTIGIHLCLVGFPVLSLAGVVVGDECARRKQLSEGAREEAINVQTNAGRRKKRNKKIEKEGIEHVQELEMDFIRRK